MSKFFVISYRLSVIGYQLLVISYWLLVIGYWLSVIGYWLLVWVMVYLVLWRFHFQVSNFLWNFFPHELDQGHYPFHEITEFGGRNLLGGIA